MKKARRIAILSGLLERNSFLVHPVGTLAAVTAPRQMLAPLFLGVAVSAYPYPYSTTPMPM